MAYRLAQANFSKGELAPALHGRFDVESYSSAAKKVRNAFVLKYGGLSKRPGTRLVAEVLDAENDVRLIPFQVSLDKSYPLEMGQGYRTIGRASGREKVWQYGLISGVAG